MPGQRSHDPPRHPPELHVDPDDLEAVARERQRLAHLVKALSGRREELDRVLKTHLQHPEEVVLAGTRFRMFATTSTEYPVESTVALLRDATSRSDDEPRTELTCIDNKAVDALLKKLGKQLEGPRLMVLKAELDAKAAVAEISASLVGQDRISWILWPGRAASSVERLVHGGGSALVPDVTAGRCGTAPGT